MVKKHITKRIVVVAALVFMAGLLLSLGLISATAKETVQKKGELYYWRFDEGEDSNTVRMYTYWLPANCTTTYANVTLPLAYSAGIDSFSAVTYGSLAQVKETLGNVGYVINDGRIAVESSNVLYSNGGKLSDVLYAYGAAVSNNNAIAAPGYIQYTVDYPGNAILVPKESVKYTSYVQGAYYSKDYYGIDQLQYAFATPKTDESKIEWILCTNTVTVRMKAEYTYTKLVPMSTAEAEGNDNSTHSHSYVHSRKLICTNYNASHTHTGSCYVCQLFCKCDYGDGSIHSWEITCPQASSHASYTSLDYTTVYNNSCTCNATVQATLFTSPNKDFISGKTFNVVGDYPVYAVEETITYYRDIECYVISTDSLKSNQKDMNVYLKDAQGNLISTENYRFSESPIKSNLKIKYDVNTGFTASGLCTNDKIVWHDNLNYTEDTAGVKGQVIKWWVSKCSEQYYTTPAKINEDIDVAMYSEYGASLYFTDANEPSKITKIKIPTQARAPKLVMVTQKNLEVTLSNLRAGKTAIRLYDGTYNSLPSELYTNGTFGDTYMYNKDSIGINGNPRFSVFAGGETGKGNTISLVELLGMCNNSYYHFINAFQVESQFAPTSTKLASRVSVTAFNAQEIFSTGKAENMDSIVLGLGTIRILDASPLNQYEYLIPNGEKYNWVTIRDSKTYKDAMIVDGAEVYLRKVAKAAENGIYNLPSTYIILTYDGQGTGQPNVYYADDYYKIMPGTINIVNDYKQIQRSGTDGNATWALNNVYTASDVFTKVKYTNGNQYLYTTDYYAAYITLKTDAGNYTYEYLIGNRDTDEDPALITEPNPELSISLSSIISSAYRYAPSAWRYEYTNGNGITGVSITYAKASEHPAGSNFTLKVDMSEYSIDASETPNDVDVTIEVTDSKGNVKYAHPINLTRYMMNQ